MRDKTLLLVCKCGDCAHWEIGLLLGNHFIKCVTCGDTHKVSFSIDPHEKLHYGPEKEATK